MSPKNRSGRSPGNPQRQVVSTGIKIEARHRYHANIDWQPGRHLWMVLGMWQIKDPESDQFQLDIENLLTIEGPGCYICEQPYSRELAARPCTGDPSGILERA